MITVKLKGGLGNQMFQYACGRAISIRSGRPLYLDISNYSKPVAGETPRDYTLYRFNIVGDVHEEDEESGLKGVARKVIKKGLKKILKKYNIGFNQRTFDKLNEEAKRGEDVVLDGFWWSEKYFKDVADIIRKEFTLREGLGDVARVVENEIRHVKTTGTKTVSIHIRRGDYILDPATNAHHGSCSKEYYEAALKKIPQSGGRAANMNLFIFSDDIEWVKTNMQFPYPTSYISQPGIEDYEELILMSQCSDHIIANSSFSWWGAWLDGRANKTVVAPIKWTQEEIADSEAMIPEEWIRV